MELAVETGQCSFGAATQNSSHQTRNVGNILAYDGSKSAAGQLTAYVQIQGRLNHDFALFADASANYEDRVSIFGGAGATHVLFDYVLHGVTSGMQGTGYSSFTNCGTHSLAAALSFYAWNNLNPDGSVITGSGFGAPCYDGDGSVETGSFNIPISNFHNGVLPFEVALAVYGRVSVKPGFDYADVDEVLDFTNTASLTGFHVMNAANQDITNSYQVLFSGPGVEGFASSAAPEPEALGLVGTGALLIGAFTRRRRVRGRIQTPS